MTQINFEQHCELTVTGPVARSVIDAIRARFDVVATRTADNTVLTVGAIDQSALRALMVMLWDSGHEVLAMSTTPYLGPTIEPGDPESDQAEVPRGADRLLSGCHTELAVEALVVGLDGVDRQEHGLSDFPLAGRARQHPQDR
jgi:hypothetical protein